MLCWNRSLHPFSSIYWHTWIDSVRWHLQAMYRLHSHSHIHCDPIAELHRCRKKQTQCNAHEAHGLHAMDPTPQLQRTSHQETIRHPSISHRPFESHLVCESILPGAVVSWYHNQCKWLNQHSICRIKREQISAGNRRIVNLIVKHENCVARIPTIV